MTGPLTLLKRSLQIFQENMRLFVGIYLVPGILAVVFTLMTEYVPETADTDPMQYVLLAIAWVVMMVASVLMAVAMIHAAADRSLSVKDAYSRSKAFFVRYVLLSIVVSITLIAGMIAFVIPGIIFFVWFAMSYYVLVLEDAGTIDSMKRSKALVKGKWWAVFGRLVVIVLFGIAAGIIAGMLGSFGDGLAGDVTAGIINLVLNAVIAPVSVVYLYEMYKDLKGGTVVDAVAQPEAV